MVKAEKRKLRSAVKLRGQEFSQQMRIEASLAICAELRKLPELVGKDIAAFVSDGSEPELKSFLKELITMGRKIILPRSNPETPSGYEMVLTKNFETELETGAYGILEPLRKLPAIRPEEYDRYVWLIPGVTFDVAGTRLGRGKGIYDRLLANCNTIVIGVFYEYQKFEMVPVDTHDRQLNLAVTEKAVYRYS